MKNGTGLHSSPRLSVSSSSTAEKVQVLFEKLSLQAASHVTNAHSEGEEAIRATPLN